MPASLKHELRTPLNHIIGYCEMLMEEAQEQGLETSLPDLERIHTAGRHLVAVINELFDPAKVSAYKSNPSLLDHEIRTPLNQIIGYAEMLQEEAGERQAFAADLQKIHAAARELLQRVIENFGSPTDWTQPAPPGATTFSRRDSGAATHRRPVGTPPAESGSLLVADDDAANREMLGRRLVRLGHRVAVAENGRETLEKLRAEPFDLLLLDIQMPELNGYEVLEQIKADPRLRNLPVIVLSASSETDRVAHCIELGAEDYLPKPFDPVLLQARIGACLEKKRLRDREQFHLKQIETEREKSERLLLNVLPKPIAERLKQGETVIADSFQDVTVLFADLVGFTSLSLDISPVQLVDLLNEIFSAFDVMAAELGLEKIKTIGDAYMAVAGLPVPRPDHAEAAAELSLRMQEEIKRFNARYHHSIRIRVGIHTGPVVAGIIGRDKFAYDLWGDTVNTASRMESHAVPGKIQVSPATHERLKAKYRFESRGEVEIKGIGRMHTFLLEGRLA